MCIRDRCIELLKSIYPRFGLNPLVKRLCEKKKKDSHLNDQSIWPYPDERIALKAKKYCDKNASKGSSYIERRHNLFFLMIRRPPRSTLSSSSAASDVYKRQVT